MKKFVSLWIIFAMLTTLLPANLVKADVAADLDVAKGYIDGIVEAAPTVEKYVFTEELAEQVDGLENILRSMTNSSAIETLDSYVTEKTTVVIEPGVPDVTHTYFTSVQAFSLAYADAQKEALVKLARPVTEAIQNLINAPLTKENYETAQTAYDESSKHIRDAVNSDDVNALNQIHELLRLAERADSVFSRIQIPSRNSDEDDYDFFMEDYKAAKTAYGLYDSKFASLKPKYYVCLQKDIKNTMLEAFDNYAKATFHADVEKAFDDLGVYNTFNDTVREKMQVLKEAVDAGQESKFRISVYDYYRGDEIQFVLDQYKHFTELEQMMSIISDTPANKTELTAALRAYRYFSEELTDVEREMLPEEYVTKLNRAVL